MSSYVVDSAKKRTNRSRYTSSIKIKKVVAVHGTSIWCDICQNSFVSTIPSYSESYAISRHNNRVHGIGKPHYLNTSISRTTIDGLNADEETAKTLAWAIRRMESEDEGNWVDDDNLEYGVNNDFNDNVDDVDNSMDLPLEFNNGNHATASMDLKVMQDRFHKSMTSDDLFNLRNHNNVEDFLLLLQFYMSAHLSGTEGDDLLFLIKTICFRQTGVNLNLPTLSISHQIFSAIEI